MRFRLYADYRVVPAEGYRVTICLNEKSNGRLLRFYVLRKNKGQCYKERAADKWLLTDSSNQLPEQEASMAEQHIKPTDPRFKDLTDKIFGLWFVREYAGQTKHGSR